MPNASTRLPPQSARTLLWIRAEAEGVAAEIARLLGLPAATRELREHVTDVCLAEETREAARLLPSLVHRRPLVLSLN